MMLFVVFLPVALLWHSSRAFPVPVDTVMVQAQRWGVGEQLEEQVLLNGVPLPSSSAEFRTIRESLWTEPLPLALVNQTSVQRNRTVLLSRDCVLEGSELRWAERVFYDGELDLTSDPSGAWSPGLQEGCVKLMRELSLSQAEAGAGIPLPQVLIPVLALLTFTGLILISLLLSKKEGLRSPGGGVIGSVIHYPKDGAETCLEKTGYGYRTL